MLILNIATAQFFQGTFQRDVTDIVNLKIAFKMKPTAAITSQISYMEAAFRFPTATTPAFTITNISTNTVAFPGINFQRFTPDFAADGFTYYKFVMNTSIVPSASYAPALEYTLFTITTSLPATETPAFEMASNLLLAQYQFGAVNGAGVFISPGNSAQLYGPGFQTSGDNHILPLFNTILPVHFKSFSVVRKNNDALLLWVAENQDANTSYFMIERSLDGSLFSLVERVEASNRTSTVSYTYTDRNALSHGKHIIYYRIKQVDKDGKFIYTEIRSIKLNSKANTTVYPNPMRDEALVSFTLPVLQKVSILVIDATGKTLMQFQFEGLVGLNQQKIEVTNLAVGTYKLLVKTETGIETLRLVVAR